MIKPEMKANNAAADSTTNRIFSSGIGFNFFFVIDQEGNPGQYN